MAREPGLLRRLLGGHRALGRHGADERRNRIGEQIEGVLDGAAAADRARVQGHPETPGQQSGLPGRLHAPFKDPALFCVQGQTGTERLKGTLGKGSFDRRQLQVQRDFPARVVLAALHHLRIGEALVVLQQTGHRQDRGRTRRPSVIRTVEALEVLIPEMLVPLARQLAIEAKLTDDLRAELAGGAEQLTLRTALAEHHSPLVFEPAGLARSPRD